MEKKKVKDLVVGDVIQEDEMIFGVSQVISKDEKFVRFLRPYIQKEVSNPLTENETFKFVILSEQFRMNLNSCGEDEYTFLGNNKTTSYL